MARRLKLYALFVGGEVEGGNIEVHDVRFVAAPSLAATHPVLRRDWWGTPASLHLDCWATLDHVDGYAVRLDATPFGGEERLFFVNLGGYVAGDFQEAHRNAFVAASNPIDAKRRALATIADWSDPHRDDLYDVDSVVALDTALAGQKVQIHLHPAPPARPLDFRCGYTPLGRKE